MLVAFEKPVFPNGVAVEADGSIVWDESYTGHVGRIRPNGKIEDLGRLPGDNPILDGMKIGADGRLYVTDIVAKGIHVLPPDGKVEGFIPAAGRRPIAPSTAEPVGDRCQRARPTAPSLRTGAPSGASTSVPRGSRTHTGAIAGGPR